MTIQASSFFKSFFGLTGHVRPTGYCWVAAFSVGLPVLSAALIGHFEYGKIAALGGMVILYLPRAKLLTRLATLGLCSFGFCVSFTLAQVGNLHFGLAAFSLAVIVFFANQLCHQFRLSTPGSFFFIMVGCMGINLPFEADSIMSRIGTLVCGTLFASLLGYLYSYYRQVKGVLVIEHNTFSRNSFAPPILYESGVKALFIGGSYLGGCLAGLDNPYWIPITCSAVLQAVNLNHVMLRSAQRIAGTLVGICIGWLILMLHPTPLIIASIIIVLMFLIERFITQNYGLAVVFITPTTLLFAESYSQIASDLLIQTRLIDIFIGSGAGLLAGWLIHHPVLQLIHRDVK